MLFQCLTILIVLLWTISSCSTFLCPQMYTFSGASPVSNRALCACIESPGWCYPFLHQPSIIASSSVCSLGCLLNIFPQNCCENSSLLSCVSTVPRSCLNVALIHIECYPHFSDHICNLSRSLNFNPGFYCTCSLLLLEIICKFNNDSLCVIIHLINEFNECYQTQSNHLWNFIQLILTF